MAVAAAAVPAVAAMTEPTEHECVDFSITLGVIPRDGSNVVHEQALELVGRLKWFLSRNRGKAKQTGLPLWELRDDSGSPLASNCFTKIEAVARLLSRVSVPLSVLTNDVMLETVTRVQFATVGEDSRSVIGYTVTPETELEIREMYTSLKWYKVGVTVERSRVANRAVDVVTYRAKSRQGNHVVGDKTILTVYEYCVDLLNSYHSQGINWRTFLKCKTHKNLKYDTTFVFGELL